MTESRDPTAIAPITDDAAGVVPASISRRMLLRGASVAAPTILTLNSNAAMGWAIASGTIGTRAPDGGSGSVLCLDRATTGAEVKPGVYSLGDPPYAEVVDVPSSYDYRRRQNLDWTGSTTSIRPEQVCSEGGAIEYKATGGGWVKLDKPIRPARYPLVSSTAVASFADRIDTKPITEL